MITCALYSYLLAFLWFWTGTCFDELFCNSHCVCLICCCCWLCFVCFSACIIYCWVQEERRLINFRRFDDGRWKKREKEKQKEGGRNFFFFFFLTVNVEQSQSALFKKFSGVWVCFYVIIAHIITSSSMC